MVRLTRALLEFGLTYEAAELRSKYIWSSVPRGWSLEKVTLTILKITLILWSGDSRVSFHSSYTKASGLVVKKQPRVIKSRLRRRRAFHTADTMKSLLDKNYTVPIALKAQENKITDPYIIQLVSTSHMPPRYTESRQFFTNLSYP
jgi:hypothetical protein